MNRLADVLLEPLFVALVVLALSYALRARAPRAARAMPAAALVLLAIFATPGVANRLERSLEQPAITTIHPEVTYDAVIVLGGTMNGTATVDTGLPQYNESVERVLAAYDLLRTNRARSAILSGTSWWSGPGEPEPEARLIAHQLVAWGIDGSRLVLDERSRNTHENAIESARLAREHGWTRDLLVTSAAHMKRARGCFAREGLDVDTMSVDFVAYDPDRHASLWLPRASALEESTAAIREWIGRGVYRVRGWTR